jgi:triosephosphate isomerase
VEPSASVVSAQQAVAAAHTAAVAAVDIQVEPADSIGTAIPALAVAVAVLMPPVH